MVPGTRGGAGDGRGKSLILSHWHSRLSRLGIMPMTRGFKFTVGWPRDSHVPY